MAESELEPNPYAPPQSETPPPSAPRRSWIFFTAGVLLAFITVSSVCMLPLVIRQRGNDAVLSLSLGALLTGCLAYYYLTARPD